MCICHTAVNFFFKRHLLNHWSKFKIISQIIPHNALYLNCKYGSAPPNKMAARSQGEKYLSKTSAESLVQIQNNFTEMFLIMPSAKIAHHSALLNKSSEYDQEIPQSQTTDNPVAPRGRAAQPSQDTRKTN